MEKKCNKCLDEKPLSEFSPRKGTPDGKNYTCKSCRADKAAELRISNGAKPNKKRQESLLEQGFKECFHCEPPKIKPLSDFSPAKRGYGGVSFCCRECACIKAVKYRENVDYSNYIKGWRKDNPRWKNQHAAHQQKRRAMKLKQDTGLVTTSFMLSLYSQSECTYCKKDIPPNKRSVDHVVPLLNGGLHDPNNLVMACISCNSAKGDMPLEKFLKRRKNALSS